MSCEEILGPPPTGWIYRLLGEVCKEGGGQIQTGPFGSQLHASDYVPYGIPSIMPQNIGDNRISEDGIARITPKDAQRLSKYLVRPGDIIYSRRGDVEKRALISSNESGWLCGTGCLRIRLGENGPNTVFASYYFGHPAVREWIVRHAHGATMPNLNTSILASCPFLLPPKKIQEAIADILGTLDDRIELNRKMNETLEQMARALFKSWFIDFDPVHAKMDGRWKKGHSLPGLPAELWDLFPDSMEQQENIKIPTGWCTSRLDSILTLAYGKSLPSEKRVPGGIPVYGSGGLNGYHNESLVTDATIIVGRKGTVGSLYWEHRPCFPIDTVYFVQSSAPMTFCYFLLESLPLKDMNTDAAVPGLNRENAYRLLFTRPPNRLIGEFDAVASKIRERLVFVQTEISTLIQVRDSLLPKLMNGEVRVPT